MKRLGLVLDQIIFEHGGRYSTDEAFIRFVEAVASSSFQRIEFCSRVRTSDADAPYQLDPAVFQIRPFPWYSNLVMLCLKSPALLPRIARILNAAMSEWDMVFAFGIHPLTPMVLRLAARRKLPAVLWIRGNIKADLRYRLRGARRVVGLAVAGISAAAIPSGTPVVSVGRDDYPFLSRMGPVHVAFSSKWGEEDLAQQPHQQRSEDHAPRLLYVGRIAPEKGLDILLEAFRRLRPEGAKARPRLTLAGSDFHGSRYGEEFSRRVRASDLADDVEMIGYVPYGQRLFQLYDSHDVFILPSLTEGFPEVLLESMARGLPVISTDVGGIQRVIRDGENGLLIPAGDPAALVAAIRRLLSDPHLWKQLSCEGLRSARLYTRQRQVESINRFISQCFPNAGVATLSAGAGP